MEVALAAGEEVEEAGSDDADEELDMVGDHRGVQNTADGDRHNPPFHPVMHPIKGNFRLARDILRTYPSSRPGSNASTALPESGEESDCYGAVECVVVVIMVGRCMVARPHFHTTDGRSAQRPVLPKPFQIAYTRPEAWRISYLYTYTCTLTSTTHSLEPCFMAHRPTQPV